MLKQMNFENIKLDIKGHMYYDFIYINSPEKATLQRQNIDLWLPGLQSRNGD